MIRGGCLCGAVRFEADEIPLLTHCHCSLCRKVSGAAFSTTACLPSSRFRFLAGADLVETYRHPQSVFTNSFCRTCGSAAPWVAAEEGHAFIPAGLLDDDPQVRPALHMFVGSKAPWWSITDDAPQFDEWVPGFGPEASRE